MSPGQSGGEEEQEERRSRLQLSTQHLLKEAREKSRGWESQQAPEHVELTFKKVRGHLKHLNSTFYPENKKEVKIILLNLIFIVC